MPDDLVDDVRLGRVERARRVAHVLGRVEDAVRERAVELAQRHQPGGGHVAEAGQRLQARADVVELRARRRRAGRARDCASRNSRIGVALVLGRELAADRPPDLLLVVGVARCAGAGSPGLPGERGGGDLVAARAVGGVVGAGVVVGQVDGDLAVLAGRHGRVELSLLEHAGSAAPSRRLMASLPSELVNRSLLAADGVSSVIMTSPIDELDARLHRRAARQPARGPARDLAPARGRARHGPGAAGQARSARRRDRLRARGRSRRHGLRDQRVRAARAHPGPAGRGRRGARGGRPRCSRPTRSAARRT